MLQSNKTVTEQGLPFWPLGALLWNSVNVTCDIFCIAGPSRHLFLTIHVDTQLGSSGIVENKWAVEDTFVKYRMLSSCDAPMDTEADTKNQI